MSPATASFYRSFDDQPLCASCAHADIPWPHTIGDVQAADRCGQGLLTAGRSQRQCFAYEGERAVLVTLASAEQAADCAWQDRRAVDGMTVRKPK